MLLERIFFCKFFALFNVDRIAIHRASGGQIHATIGWPDEGQPYYEAAEEVQEILWECGSIPGLWDLSLAVELIAKLKLLRGDRIEVEPAQLCSLLSEEFSWSDERARAAIKSLLAIKIDRIDDGELGDYFFLHF